MPDYVDTMMYVGDTPWHGIGTPLENPPSIEEAILKASLNWEVVKKPTYVIMDKGTWFDKQEGKFTGHYVTIRSDSKEILGNVGERYTVLQNADAFEPFQPMLDWGFTLETAGSIKDGRKVWILAKAPEEYTVGDDAIHRYVLLYTSHDGSSGNCFRDTLVRVVCNNTLNLALDDKKNSTFEYSLRHTASIKQRVIDLRDRIEESAGNVQKAVGYMNKMYDRLFNQSEAEVYFEHVIPFLAHRGAKSDTELGIYRKDMATPVFEQLMQNYSSGRGNNGKTLWDAYNSVTEYYDHQKNYKDWMAGTQFGKASEYKRRALLYATKIITNDMKHHGQNWITGNS